MDLETENRIAAILLREAAELRQQAERDGVHAYLRQPNVRGRPNSRFLTATVRSVQQANQVVEVNEMWRVRQKEIELDNKLKGIESTSHRHHRDVSVSPRRTNRHADDGSSGSDPCSSTKRVKRDFPVREVEGLKDDEVEEFLHSRVKRGRGSVGSRMDETGPYLPSHKDLDMEQLASVNDVGVASREWERRVLGPEKHSSSNPGESSEDESRHDRRRKKKKTDSEKKQKHFRKDGSKDKKQRTKEEKRREEKRYKHHK